MMLFKKKIEIREHGSPIYSVDGKDFFVYTTAGDRFILKWDLKQGKQDRFAIKIDNTSYHLKLHNDKLLIGTKKGELYVIDTHQKVVLQQRKISEDALHSMLVNKDELLIGTAAGEIIILDFETLADKNHLNFACGKVRDLMTIDTERIGIASQDGYIRILMANDYELEHQFSAHPKGANKLLIHEGKLLSSGKDGCLREWNWEDEVLLNTWPIHRGTIYDMGFVGKYLVTASRDKTLKIWEFNPDLSAVQRITIVNGGHSYSVNAIHVINESNFCSVGDDRRLIWWSLDSDD